MNQVSMTECFVILAEFSPEEKFQFTFSTYKYEYFRIFLR